MNLKNHFEDVNLVLMRQYFNAAYNCVNKKDIYNQSDKIFNIVLKSTNILNHMIFSKIDSVDSVHQTLQLFKQVYANVNDL